MSDRPTQNRSTAGQNKGGTVTKTGLSKGTRVTGKSRDRLQNQLKKQYEAGASIRSLARSTGRSYGFIHNVLVESHVQLRSRGGANRRKSADK
ncbi:helix-turn-helix domain-containing protein [Nocardia shimofusensis]|uniref:helix-turn-helix domain-containing protein n=1 Tax=Nocardia shimofusensis TaxID=228596 RepID=UPI000AFE8797|nr:helix-turn-helix domain-containing protein [Nocardia shimofusensis]